VVLLLAVRRAQLARSQGPPLVLVMAHESVKPGVAAASERNEQGYARLYATLKAPARFIGANSLSGSPETLFLDPCYSVAPESWVMAAPVFWKPASPPGPDSRH
jgi:hypothetical protein